MRKFVAKALGSKTSVMVGLAFVFMISITIVYTNCGRAVLGGTGQDSVSAQNGGQSVVVSAGSCPVGQVAIGINNDQTLICVAARNAGSPNCPAARSFYEMVSGNSVCVLNTAWDQQGAVCPIGQYLVSYSTAGNLLCTGAFIPSNNGPINLSCPSGQYVSGVANNAAVCTALPAQTSSAFVCSTGQFLADLTVSGGSSTADCRAIPWGSGPGSTKTGDKCPDGSYLIGYNASSLVCQSNQFNATQTAGCAPGLILTSFTSSGAVCVNPPNPDLSHACPTGLKGLGIQYGKVICEDVKPTDTTICPVGQFVISVSAGQPQCGAVAVNHLPGACPISSYPIGVSNGAVVCVPLPKRIQSNETRVCAPGSQAICSISGGVGLQTCATDGAAFGSCKAISCAAGYSLKNDACVATSCVPGSNQSCSVANGTGQQFCGTNGSWGACQIVSCQAGFVANYSGGSPACLANVCVPGSSQACGQDNAHGTQICSTQGSGYGACVINSCSNGYTLVNGACNDTTAPRITFTSQPANPTIGNSASLVYAAIDNESGIDRVVCSLDGNNYLPCSSPVALSGLANGPHKFTVTATDKSGNSATAISTWTTNACTGGSTAQCSVPNGAGTKLCSADGTYGVCVPSSCSDGYQLIPGGCAAVQCGAGYSIVGNGCVDNTPPTLTITKQPQDPSIGTSASVEFTTQDQGSGVAQVACKLDQAAASACNSPVVLNNLSVGHHVLVIVAVDQGGNRASKTVEWNQYSCSPGNVNTCSITNGSGAQTCSADGSGYGSCMPSACDAGYTSSQGLCRDVSGPTITVTSGPANPTVATDASIRFSTSDAGSGVASVTCALDQAAPAACNNQVSYSALSPGAHTGSIVATDVAGNATRVTYSWTVQACAPSSVAACNVPNGSGRLTCSADGSGWGACAVNTCTAGYFANGATCDAIPLVPIYRFFSTVTAEHFYTATESEGVGLFSPEGTRFSLYARSTDGMYPIYRCLQKDRVMHFISRDANCEGSPNTVNEGAYGNVYADQQPGTVPLLRYYLHPPSRFAGDHLVTTDPGSEWLPLYTFEHVLGYVPAPK